jgi:hypothetical protein
LVNVEAAHVGGLLCFDDRGQPKERLMAVRRRSCHPTKRRIETLVDAVVIVNFDGGL